MDHYFGTSQEENGSDIFEIKEVQIKPQLKQPTTFMYTTTKKIAFAMATTKYHETYLKPKKQKKRRILGFNGGPKE